jgi:predicted GNAT family N-acyltransferase
MRVKFIHMAMGKLTYKLMASDADLRKAFDVRRQVFVREQGISEDLVFDNNDRDALHVVVEDGERIIGTARVRFLGNKQAKLERMAVTKSFRRKGIGKGIVSFMNEELRKKQVEQVVLHAQLGVVEFYKSCGFEVSGLPFWEANIKHTKMQTRL